MSPPLNSYQKVLSPADSETSCLPTRQLPALTSPATVPAAVNNRSSFTSQQSDLCKENLAFPTTWHFQEEKIPRLSHDGICSQRLRFLLFGVSFSWTFLFVLCSSSGVGDKRRGAGTPGCAGRRGEVSGFTSDMPPWGKTNVQDTPAWVMPHVGG